VRKADSPVLNYSVCREGIVYWLQKALKREKRKQDIPQRFCPKEIHRSTDLHSQEAPEGFQKM